MCIIYVYMYIFNQVHIACEVVVQRKHPTGSEEPRPETPNREYRGNIGKLIWKKYTTLIKRIWRLNYRNHPELENRNANFKLPNPELCAVFAKLGADRKVWVRAFDQHQTRSKRSTVAQDMNAGRLCLHDILSKKKSHKNAPPIWAWGTEF